MSCRDADSRPEMAGTSSGGSGRNLQGPVVCAPSLTARKENSRQENSGLMEAVVERENMLRALHQVEANKGSAGVDGVTVEALRAGLCEHWPRIKEELLEGRYRPQPVRKVEIPKPGGKGMRQLGIPTVMDRLIQQALNQVMQPIFDPDFSESSYGFRPGRSAHQAVLKAREYAASGRRWVVDMDLEKFFDRVNHDILMARLARKIADKRVLGVIRRYLQAGLMVEGVVSPRTEGTPQGGPLSPLLSNILLDDLDRELEKRGHAFCRYADDCNIYVKTRRAGQRVLDSLTRFLEDKLKLKVNSEKSAVARPWDRKFLGYSMTFHKQPRLKVAPAVVERMKAKLREKFRAGRGRNLRAQIEELTPVLRGWVNYFRLAEVKGVFEELDGWIRRRLRCILWRQWKRSRTRAKKLMRYGLGEERAWKSATNGRGPWWNSRASHMNQCFPKIFFDRLGLVSLLNHLRRLQCAS
jgi:RNA-directed DNA polymerase